jgi:hypothetical protein
MVAMFVNRWGQNEQSNKRPSIDAFFSFSLEIEVRNKNCLWQLCLLTDLDEMSNINRVPTIDASYQVSVPLAKCFQRRRFHKN